MNRLIWCCLLGGACALFPAPARAAGRLLPPVKIDAGINARFNVYVLDAAGMANLAPWYTYFPYEAYFQTPAPVGGFFPNWPAPQQYGFGYDPAYGAANRAPGVAPGAPGAPGLPGGPDVPPDLMPPPVSGVPGLPPNPPPGPDGNISAPAREHTSGYRAQPQQDPAPVAAPYPQSVPSYWHGR